MEPQEALKRFLGDLDSEHTRRSYKYTLIRFKGYAESCNLCIISGERAQLRQCMRAFFWESGWKNHTAKYRLAALKAFYRWLERGEGVRSDNPADLLKLPEDEEPYVEIACPSSELADKLLQYIEGQKDRWAIRDLVIVLLLREAGLRSHELLALKLDDIKLDESRSVVLVRNGKGRKPRYVALPRVTAGLILKLYVPAYGIKEILFPSTHHKGKAITRQTVWNMLTARAKAAGFTPDEIQRCRSPHAWRHLWTTEQIAKNINPLLIQKMGGWSTSRMIQNYMVQEQLAAISNGA